MKTIKVIKSNNSIFIRLQNDRLVTLLQYNIKFETKANNIIDNCLLADYILIET